MSNREGAAMGRTAWVVEISTGGLPFDPITIYETRAGARKSMANVSNACRGSRFRVVKYARVEK